MLNYRHRYRYRLWWIAGLTLVALIVFFVLASTFRQAFTGPLVFFTKPLWQTGDNLGALITDQVANLSKTRQQLIVENKKLQEENNRLKIIISAKNNLESDNSELRLLLGKKEVSARSLTSRVIFLPNFVPYNSLLLDLGLNNRTHPFKIGDLVIADQVVLIGRIAEIGPTYSKARLISAEDNLPVIIGDKNIPAVATGSGAGNFTVTLPKDILITIGDKVRVPLHGGYLVGSVGHIEKLASRPTQTLLIQTPINLFQLKWVEIYDFKI